MPLRIERFLIGGTAATSDLNASVNKGNLNKLEIGWPFSRGMKWNSALGIVYTYNLGGGIEESNFLTLNDFWLVRIEIKQMLTRLYVQGVPVKSAKSNISETDKEFFLFRLTNKVSLLYKETNIILITFSLACSKICNPV